MIGFSLSNKRIIIKDMQAKFFEGAYLDIYIYWGLLGQTYLNFSFLSHTLQFVRTHSWPVSA